MEELIIAITINTRHRGERFAREAMIFSDSIKPKADESISGKELEKTVSALIDKVNYILFNPNANNNLID